MYTLKQVIQVHQARNEVMWIIGTRDSNFIKCTIGIPVSKQLRYKYFSPG